MAAPRGSVSDSESSEDGDAEELQRCREAALPAWGWGPRPERGQEAPAADPLPAARPSLRQKADEHEQDGNELQTTPEFRLHVAKKLGAFLDSCITISESSPRPAQAPVQTEAGEDDGFRLFFTSIPGSPKKEAGPPAVSRKRPPSSSSESDSGDEWRRCREAAVSAGDILRQGAQPMLASTAAKEQAPKQAQARPNKEAGPRVTTEEQPGGTVRHNGDHATLPTKKKKKKKKKLKESEPCPRQKGHGPRVATE
ncbi:protein CUSTOS isoform X2 [Sarcophilus harrisii]|uniref:protein CUSTOS isoform X2 n=1 Tax=Sarcophilus harrisii TaxID=9305 RepID=UPI001302069D|nr:protein CUSTOS isoform X2 [Sarcophilus harrisii]